MVIFVTFVPKCIGIVDVLVQKKTGPLNTLRELIKEKYLVVILRLFFFFLFLHKNMFLWRN